LLKNELISVNVISKTKTDVFIAFVWRCSRWMNIYTLVM